MNQVAQNTTMKERLMDNSSNSDTPTITHVTTRAIIFYISAIAAIIGMFGNWLEIDLDLGYLKLENLLGTINPFTISGAVGEIQDKIVVLSSLLPNEVAEGLSMLKLFGIGLLLLASCSLVFYLCAIFLRMKENDRTVIFGRLGAVCALLSVVGFIGIIVSMISTLGVSSKTGSIIGEILTGPCLLTLIGAAVSCCCAVMDMAFKEDVVIYHDGVMKIAREEKWRCRCCRRRNLSLLEKCYYCGKEKEQSDK